MSIDREQIRTALRAAPVALALVLLLVPASGPGASEQSAPATIENRDQLVDWSKGAVRWLLLPAEMRDLGRVASDEEVRVFVRRFWARRDADPATPGNSYRDNFLRLVEAADLLYSEAGVRGSLTDRGRALILLGAPSGLRVSSQEALEWEPASGASDNVRVRYLPIEIWTYEAEDFSRALRLALKAVRDQPTYQVSFVEGPDRTALSEGEELLELAARTALALP